MTTNTQLAETGTRPSAIAMMADRLAISQQNLVKTLKATAFKTCQNDEQFAALMIVANEYQLNPLTKEIYAFPGKGGEVVPIVSIDGWLRIINSHPQFDGMDEEFGPDGAWCKVTMYRKDRSRPIVHTEYLEEVRRNTEPWKQHTRRMLKWKTIIQAARISFGFGGIYDEDEGRDVAMRAAEGRVVEDRKLPTTNPFEPGIAEDDPEPVSEEEIGKPAETPGDDNGMIRAFYSGHKTQTSRADAKKPWKLWRVELDIAGGASIEAVTFSETDGELIESLEDGDEVFVELKETQKGHQIERIERGAAR